MSSSVSSRRIPRGTRSAITVSRPPLLIQFGDQLVKAGYAGEKHAKSIVPTTTATPKPSLAELTPAECYRRYSPVLQQALSFLSQDLSERKAVVLFDSGFVLRQCYREALERILFDAGIQAVSFYPAMELVAFALPLPDMMVVYISNGGGEAHCLAHASGQALEYTYQACGLSKEGGIGTLGDHHSQWESDWLNPEAPDSLITTILKCLQACPRQVRNRVIANMVFAGDVVVYPPSIDVVVARIVRAALKGEQNENLPPSNQQPVADFVLTRVPISPELQPLADSVGVVNIPCLRAESYAWMGASVWAAFWHGRDPGKLFPATAQSEQEKKGTIQLSASTSFG